MEENLEFGCLVTIMTYDTACSNIALLEMPAWGIKKKSDPIPIYLFSCITVRFPPPNMVNTKLFWYLDMRGSLFRTI